MWRLMKAGTRELRFCAPFALMLALVPVVNIILPISLGLLVSPYVAASPRLMEKYIFNKVDLDGDGLLSRDEYELLNRRIFVRLDMDDNGSLGQNERRYLVDLLAADFPAQPETHFRQVDFGVDEVLVFNEWLMQRESLFKKADIDKSGNLRLSEFSLAIRERIGRRG